MNNKFYVYRWYNLKTNETFYIGKGCKRRASEKVKRNKLFLDYINKNKCDYEIIEYFENEEEAYKKEQLLIQDIKPICNIALGGYGGFSIVWTNELKKWKSENNPMKDEKRRKNMSLNNPMKNKEIANKVGISHKKTPIINGKEFIDCKSASEYYNVHICTVQRWCKRGYDTNGNPCKYKNEEQCDFHFKKTNSSKVYIDDKLFNSVKEASEYIGVWSESLIRAIKNNRKCKGHFCKYANQQPSQVNVEENSNLEGSETNE